MRPMMSAFCCSLAIALVLGCGSDDDAQPDVNDSGAETPDAPVFETGASDTEPDRPGRDLGSDVRRRGRRHRA